MCQLRILILLFISAGWMMPRAGVAASPETCPSSIVPTEPFRPALDPLPEPITVPPPEASNLQDPTNPAPDESAAPPHRPATPNQALDDLKSLVLELSRQRQQLSTEVHAIETGMARATDKQPARPPVFGHIEKEITDVSTRQNQKLLDLRNEIHRLQEMLSRPASQAQNPAPPPPTEAARVPPQPLADVLPDVPPVWDRVPRPSASAGKELVAVPITDEPVDRLGLADSLFATGEFQLALEIYTGLSATNRPSDQKVWAEHQTAACHRQLGNDVEAETHYRRIAGNDHAGFLAENARWWLTVMGQRRDAQGKYDRIKSTVDEIGVPFNE